MKTILTTLFSVSILATMAIAGPGCSGYKEVTLAEQKSHAHEVLVVEIDGMELFQLTNQEGKIFFKGCQEIVERYHELEDAVRRQQKPSGRSVRVAAIYSVGLHHLSQYVDQFRTLVPGAGVDLEYMHPDEICERVLNDQSDLGLMSFISPGRDLTAIPWQRQLMVIACSPGHSLARRITTQGALRPEDLQGERFVAFDRELPARRAIDRFLRKHNVRPNVVMELDHIATIKHAVEVDIGVSILPKLSVQYEQSWGTLTATPFNNDTFARPVGIIYRKGRSFSLATQKLIEILSNGTPEPIPESNEATSAAAAS